MTYYNTLYYILHLHYITLFFIILFFIFYIILFTYILHLHIIIHNSIYTIIHFLVVLRFRFLIYYIVNYWYSSFCIFYEYFSPVSLMFQIPVSSTVSFFFGFWIFITLKVFSCFSPGSLFLRTNFSCTQLRCLVFDYYKMWSFPDERKQILRLLRIHYKFV